MSHSRKVVNGAILAPIIFESQGDLESSKNYTVSVKNVP
jgi:hypothetical protein